MTTYDLCVAWNWPHDAGFIALLRQACRERGLSLLEVTPETLHNTHQALLNGTLSFLALLDRASDTDSAFFCLVTWARGQSVFRINPHEQEAFSADKATMHLELIAAGLPTPYSIILSPYDHQPELGELDISPLGERFAIKPANGGGGEGVICEATSHQQVADARRQFPHDKYLLQAHVAPSEIDGQPAWFRVIYCLGELYVNWWPPHTHIYRPVEQHEVIYLRLGELYDMAVRIARVSNLHLFSSEIALTGEDKFLAVDYVNDQIDLRLQSQTPDGVPDATVQDICRRIAAAVWHHVYAFPGDHSMSNPTPTTLPARSELDIRYTWNAESVFPTVNDWEAEFAALAADLPTLRRFEGHLAEGPATLADARAAMEAAAARLQRLAVYTGMDSAVDTTNQAATERDSKLQGLYGQFLAAISFLEPELLAIGLPTLQSWLAEEPRLAVYAHYFETLFRRQTHVRSAEVEELLGMAADPFSGPYSAWQMLTNADIQFPPALGSDGVELPLSQSTYEGLLGSPDRELRRTAWERYHDQYLAHKNLLTTNYLTSVKQNVLQMRARRYDSTLEMALFDNAIPTAVFHNLIDTFKKHIPVWHRYWAVRRRALGVDTLHPCDIWAPLTPTPARVSYGQAVEWIAAALAPLGEEYTGTLRRGCLQDRWVDVYPNQGKGSGAFSTGAPGVFPFIFMSFSDDTQSMGTLTHELGHSMHTYLTGQTQPLVYQDYTLFAAEVASNFHQAMTRAYLLEQDLPRELQIGIIEEAMNNFHRYFLIMPTLARFELEVHQRVERGDGITADAAIELLAGLAAEGYGDEMTFDPQRVGIDWATFPHLFADYYVFQYATGISGAHALANRILSGVPGAVDDYLGFLRAGSSRYPLDALRAAGVDLASPQPVEETFAVLGRLIDRLESLL
ncbi:MAG: oligoendopeptidase F [Caldilineales bacterium]